MHLQPYSQSGGGPRLRTPGRWTGFQMRHLLLGLALADRQGG